MGEVLLSLESYKKAIDLLDHAESLSEEEKEEIELKTNEWGERSVSGKDNVSSLLQGFKVTFVSFCLFSVIKLSTY